MDSLPPTLLQRIWRSINRHGWSLAPLDRSLAMTSNLFLHLHPVKVSRRSLRFSYSMGLGLVSIVSLLILIGTGALLMFHYSPSVERAYTDVVELQTAVPFGQLLRNLHRWAAHLMVLVAVLHMLRVFYTGAYKPPREFNWVLGCALLLLTLGASFTGYLLPWDQLSYWAITVATSMAEKGPLLGTAVARMLLGGREVGQESLLRFYTLHVAVIPLAISALIALHLWRVRKDGGLAANEVPTEHPPEKHPGKTRTVVKIGRGAPTRIAETGSDDKVFAWPVVVILELLLLLGTCAALLVFSLLKDAPLEELANPLQSTDPAKAPWYFVGLQEMLEHAHPLLAGIILPTLAGIFLVAIPYVDHSREGAGRWFTNARGKWITFWTALYTLVAAPAYILLDDAFPPRELLRGKLPMLVTQSIIPCVVLTLLTLVPVGVLFVASRRRPTAREVVLVLFTLLVVSGLVATTTGFLFRGPGFQLYWPWDMPGGYNPFHSL